MNILGISCFYHDAAAALIKDGMLVAAAEEERFSRKKHDSGFPVNAIDFCLKTGGISTQQLDYVVFYEKPFLKFERILLTIMDTFPMSANTFRSAMNIWFGEKLWIKSIIRDKVNVPAEKVLFSEHHLSHAASALFCSPFTESAILTTDGVGEWTTTSLGKGRASWQSGDNSIELFADLKFPNSLGMLYSVFTAYLGFEVNEGEYKVMGMAPYGKPKYVDKVYQLLDMKDDGSFQMDLDYFTYHRHTTRAFNAKFEKLFGQSARNPKARFVTTQTSLYDDPNPPTAEELKLNQFWADIAASVQKATEEILLKIANYLYSKTGLDKLCIAGGVGLNSVANYRIFRETPFKEIYVHPAAGDSGGAIGAALYVYHVVLKQPRKFIMKHAFWGKDYGEDDIKEFLNSNNIKYERLEDGRLLDRVVETLTSGKIVGWYQGQFEWGPRALGNRSILADPRRADMKDIVNIKIKFREPFRPFAPSVIEPAVNDYFELSPPYPMPANFMLLVTPVKSDKRSKIPAVTHADGTGRLQVVQKDTNPRYYNLIEKFGQATGVPVVLNTSFNLRGEPIVTTPENAFQTFSRSGIDALVLGNYLVKK